MKIAVTGGTGFIGSHFVEALLARGDSVRILTRDKVASSSGVATQTTSQSPQKVYISCNYDRIDSISSAIDGCDWVIHLAAALRATNQSQLPAINRKSTENLLTAIQTRSVPPKLLLCSSQAAAGPARRSVPLTDDDPAQPISWYGKSKRAQEEVVLAAGNSLWWTVLRPPAVFGPREKDIFVFFRVLSRGWSTRIGNVKRQFSWIYVTDFIEAILSVMDSDACRNQINFVKSGDTDWEEFRAAAAEALQVKYRVVTMPETFAKLVANFSEFATNFTGKPALLNRDKILELSYSDWRCDDTAFRHLTGLTNRTSLKIALQETIDWYRMEKWL
ncbi:MAG: NAD(P)-dependent oxidoreductase [bacterium]|nr:NAD(P)-dependent oxidoreductase [bacterium]